MLGITSDDLESVIKPHFQDLHECGRVVLAEAAPGVTGV
jgi:hypothetical protein